MELPVRLIYSSWLTEVRATASQGTRTVLQVAVLNGGVSLMAGQDHSAAYEIDTFFR